MTLDLNLTAVRVTFLKKNALGIYNGLGERVYRIEVCILSRLGRRRDMNTDTDKYTNCTTA